LENAGHVKNEDGLRATISDVSKGKSVTIALDNDVTLSETLSFRVEKMLR
jgi:hypothetical protein